MTARPIAEPPVGPWQPPAYRVDEHGKVVGARPGVPNNWGRWGELDQLGTFNLLTEERARRAAGLVRTGKRFSLGVPIGKGVPFPGSREIPLHVLTRAASDWVVGDPGPYGMQCTDDVIVVNLQAASQLDGLAHVGYEDTLYNGFWAGAVTASSGARRLGVHHCLGKMVGRGVLIDVARHGGVRVHVGGIGPDVLDEVLAAQGVDTEPGDLLLVRTGILGSWYEDRDGSVFRNAPGLTTACLPWLAERDIAFVGADNRAVEVIPGPPDQPRVPFHIGALRDLGMPLGEILELDALAADCANDGVFEFMLVAEPLPVVYAAGAPLNPIAIK